MEERAVKVLKVIGVIVIVLLLYGTAFLLPVIGAIAEWFNSLSYVDDVFAVMIILILILPPLLSKKVRIEPLVVGILFFLFLILGVIVHYAVVVPSTGGRIGNEYVSFIDTPINVTMSRIVPLKTAYAYAISELQIPTHTIYESESYIYYNGTVPVYNWIVEPEGTFNSWTKDAYGVVFVSGEYPPEVKFVEKDLTWSLHRGRFGLVYWNLHYAMKKMRITEQPIFEDNMEVMVNGTIYILIPFKTWSKIGATSVPTLSGYAIIREDGEMRFVPADRIHEDSVLNSILKEYRIAILPEVIAREWIELLRWSPGFTAVVFHHQTFEIRDIGTNPQPYLVFDENGHLWWLFTVEPAGESYAVKYLIYVDAESTTPKILIYKPHESWIGASKVEEYVKRAHPVFDWGEFSIEEPIPLVINGTLYWKVSIVTKDGRGLVSIDLVNAKTGEVHSLKVEKKVSVFDFYLFIKESIEGVTTTPSGENQTTIYERIQNLKQRIEEMQRTLNEMYRELEELESMIGNGTNISKP